ncbi:MAG: gliding motility-associated ABC transporter ATP-binding subunit GldA [Bacteroidales bacterium]|nr:gliding motility-associated ABC transporter ATP-binding subunit GldA [Bacteroidales bacterium]
MSIEIQHITKQYGEQLALNDVTLNIDKGIVGLLGPNGAGKSTLMKIITCFIPPTSGTASVNGFDVMEQSMEVKRIVGYLPEHNPLYLDMYVREYLDFVAGIHQLKGDAARKRIETMVEVTGLGPEAHKKIGALSKGYRQRVGLAQAMMHNPQVLILDEPTSGLDPNQLIDIRNLISELGKEKTVLLSTHIMQEVEAICQRAIIINKGVVVADDKIENLKQENSASNVVIVEFENEVTQQLLLSIPQVCKVKRVKDNHWILEPEGDADIRANLMKWSVDHNLIIKTLQKEDLSIEEAFQKLTRYKPFI